VESREIWNAFMSERCAGCEGVKCRRKAFCRACYGQLPPALKNALWQTFGSGFEQAYMGCLSWFRTHPLQGEHRAKQKSLFEEGA
jgi:hypothetical protein